MRVTNRFVNHEAFGGGHVVLIELYRIDPKKGSYTIDECNVQPDIFKTIPFQNNYMLYHGNEKRIVGKEDISNSLFAATLGVVGIQLGYVEKLRECGLL